MAYKRPKGTVKDTKGVSKEGREALGSPNDYAQQRVKESHSNSSRINGEAQLNSIADQITGMRKTLGDKDGNGIRAEKDAPFFKHTIKDN